MNQLERLRERGQSVWLDYIRRGMLENGELERLVGDGLRGMTSNPQIFHQAIADSDEYDDAIRAAHQKTPQADAHEIYERLAIDDIRHAADILRPVWDESGGDDGFVSLEVDPRLADETSATLYEARRLFKTVGRPNVLIKVPATRAGLPAIETLIAEGVNVNITLMFSLDHYEKVAQAYLRGLERCTDPSGVASVASIFVSRIDRAVDQALAEIGSDEAREIRGRIAIDNSRRIYRRFRQIFHGEPFAAARARGARRQRVLWASTSTKDPSYSDVRYVEELIGPETVNTMPPKTLDAFRDHGEVRGDTIEEHIDRADLDMIALEDLGIDFHQVTEDLQRAGVKKFVEPFEALLDALRTKRREVA